MPGFSCIPNEAIDYGFSSKRRKGHSTIEAIVWLYKESRVDKDGKRKVHHSLSFISKAWNWSIASVRQLVAQLVARGVARKVQGKIQLFEEVTSNGRHEPYQVRSRQSSNNYNKQQTTNKFRAAIDTDG